MLFQEFMGKELRPATKRGSEFSPCGSKIGFWRIEPFLSFNNNPTFINCAFYYLPQDSELISLKG